MKLFKVTLRGIILLFGINLIVISYGPPVNTLWSFLGGGCIGIYTMWDLIINTFKGKKLNEK